MTTKQSPKAKEAPEIVRQGFDAKYAASVIGMSLSSVNRALRTGEIPSTKIGRRRIISQATIDKILCGGA